MINTIFDSGKEPLSRLLDEAAEGKLRLPDFQRGWVWDDYGIRSLLASISNDGAIMFIADKKVSRAYLDWYLAEDSYAGW